MRGKRQQDSLGGGTREIIMGKDVKIAKYLAIIAHKGKRWKSKSTSHVKGTGSRKFGPSLLSLVTFLVASELSYLSEH